MLCKFQNGIIKNNHEETHNGCALKKSIKTNDSVL